MASMRSILVLVTLMFPLVVAQLPPSKESVEALQYNSSDAPLTPIAMVDIDRTRLAYITAQLGKSEAARYAGLSETEKNTLFIDAFSHYAERKKNERNRLASLKQNRQLMRAWRLNADKLEASPESIDNLNRHLDNDSIRSSKIVQDFLNAHKERMDHLAPLELLDLEARLASAYIRRSGAEGGYILVAVLPNPILRTQGMQPFFQTDGEMAHFYEVHRSTEQIVQGIREQLLLFTLRLLQPETEKSWGTPENLKMLIGDAEWEVVIQGKSGGERGNVDGVLGVKAAKMFDAGIDSPGVTPPTSAEERQANQYRLYAVADAVIQLDGIIDAIVDAPPVGGP